MKGRRCGRCAILLFILPALCLRAHAEAGPDVPGCGNLGNAYGPFDYTNAADFRDKLPIVEAHHFGAGVEALSGQQQRGASLGGDLDYTLRAFPNHARALDAIGRYQLQLKRAPVPGAQYSAECYFERAMAFAPTDGTVHMVYGIYFTRKGDRDAALEQYLEAQRLMPESVELHYNLGLLYTSLGRYDDALSEAHQAYAGGFPLMGLKNKLMRVGVWREPPPAAPVETGAAPVEGSDAATDGDASGPAQPRASDSDSEGQ